MTNLKYVEKVYLDYVREMVGYASACVLLEEALSYWKDKDSVNYADHEVR